MSDTRIRQLERTFKQTGTLEDELNWIRERKRSGELTNSLCLDFKSYRHQKSLLNLHNYLTKKSKLIDISYSLNQTQPYFSCQIEQNTQEFLKMKNEMITNESRIGLRWSYGMEQFSKESKYLCSAINGRLFLEELGFKFYLSVFIVSNISQQTNKNTQ